MTKLVSLCTTCCNRVWQLRQTLPDNLAALPPHAEIVLVDYGSTDGLADWVWQHFKPAIDDGRLTFFQVTSEVTWNCPKAKNLAHRLALGQYLFNVDADNFVTPEDHTYLLQALRTGLPSQQWSGDWDDGSFGRIGLPREMFFHIGGYDESLLPMGGQDIDLLRRLGTLDDRFFKMTPPNRSAILNTMAQKIAQMNACAEDPRAAYEAMNQINLEISQHRLATEGPVRKGGFATFKGTLNGRAVIVDGFNIIRQA